MDNIEVLLAVLQGGAAFAAVYDEQQQKKRKVDHWQLPRSTQRTF
jgi:hypothetical protein